MRYGLPWRHWAYFVSRFWFSLYILYQENISSHYTSEFGINQLISNSLTHVITILNYTSCGNEGRIVHYFIGIFELGNS